MSPLAMFHCIVQYLEQRHSHLNRSYMLAGPAIEYKGRVFAFYSRDNMVIKFNDAEVLEFKGIRATQQFRPFSNKAVLSQWREVPFYYRDDWSSLAELALDALRAEID